VRRLFALALALPKGCAPSSSAPEPPPPPSPVTSATTPPVWTPPDPGGPLPSATPAPNPELVKARQLAQAGDHKRVRTMLEKKVRAGKGTREEAAMLMDACVALRDKACVEAVHARHPDLAE
jgi:hypothetical protein